MLTASLWPSGFCLHLNPSPCSPWLSPGPGPSRTNKGLPGSWVLTLSPAIGPSQHHRVMPHAAQATRLDEVGQPLTHLAGYHHLAEALHFLNLHHVLDCLLGTHQTQKARRRHRGRVFKMGQPYPPLIQFSGGSSAVHLAGQNWAPPLHASCRPQPLVQLSSPPPAAGTCSAAWASP